MQHPRTNARNYQQPLHSHQKTELLQDENEDREEPFLLQKLAKNFQHSVGFSETNFSFSRSQGFSEGPTGEHRPSSAGQHQQLNLSSELRKAGLIPSEGVSRFRSLLPPHLSAKLSPVYETLLRVSAQTDKILSLRSLCGYKQSFVNLKLHFQQSLLIEINFSIFEAINYLKPGMYVVCLDPFENLVVGLPESFQEIAMRRFRLRKEVYHYASRYARWEEMISEVEETVPLKPYNTTKTHLFFPLSHKAKKVESLDPQFLTKLKQDIKQKETLSCHQNQSSFSATQPLQPAQFLQVMDLLQKCFSSFKVSNMYLINLISWLKRHTSKIPIQHYLHIIYQTGTYLIRKEVQGSIVLELKKEEKNLLFAKIDKQ